MFRKTVKAKKEKKKNPKLGPKPKQYRINDNGNKPFQVTIYPNKLVEIKKGVRDDSDDYDENRKYDQLITRGRVKQVYLGESPCELALIPGFDCGAETLGNSVLFQVTDKRFVFVGKEIYEFSMEPGDTVEGFYSAISSNSVSYPVLLGTNNVYFMLDKQFVARSLFTARMNDTEWADAYSYLYGMKNIRTGEQQDTDKPIPVSELKPIRAVSRRVSLVR